jgi:hypothetical protein
MPWMNGTQVSSLRISLAVRNDRHEAVANHFQPRRLPDGRNS